MITSKSGIDTFTDLFSDSRWRINNLYKIVDKSGRKITFNMNWAQEQLYDDMWYCNIILKARQLGISTFICLLFLDRCLFNPNLSAGIIAHTKDDAEALFRRVKIAYDSLPEQIKQARPADTDTAQMIKFSNGSNIRVGTSLRSSTFQYLHISEFGKICAKYPDKAQEIITGSLNTVAPGQYIFIESTAEGRDGYFYEMCKRAQADREAKKKLSKLDYRFHFFPWYKEPTYRIGSIFPVNDDMQEYFDHLKLTGVELDDEQKHWYIGKETTQKDDMRREYPSTPEESWEVSNEGLYYCKQMTAARAEKRIGFVPYDENLEVHTSWDLGYNDSNAIWFVQIFKKEIRVIDYEEGSGESLAHWIKVVKNKDYAYGKHIAPHDIMVKEYTSGMSRQATARGLGLSFIPAQKTEIIPGIDAVRNMFSRCWFDESRCSKGLKALDNYKKDWDERHACWRSQPLHNWASHGCFTGDTLVLTRFGMYPIMSIKKDMEILTLEGWKKCNQASITKKNAQLVAVTFKDGTKVRCTPDHLFLTMKGWISAKYLEKDLKIQSSSMFLQHTSEDHYIGFGRVKDISKKVARICIEMFGKMPLVKYLQDVIYIIKTMTLKTIDLIISNAFPLKFIYLTNNQILKAYPLRREKKLKNGINQMQEENGIDVMQYDQRDGLNGKEKKDHVHFVKSSSIVSSEKMDWNRNIALLNANQLIVEKVENLEEKEDVYCINVPEIAHFSLSNGAIVHNSDAFRTLATGLNYISKSNDKPPEMGGFGGNSYAPTRRTF